MKKTVTLGIAAVAIAGIIGVATANTQAAPNQNRVHDSQGYQQMRNGNGGGRQAMLETRAEMFGMTVNQLQEQLQTKTMSQIAVEKGISAEEFRTKMQSTTEERWRARGLSDEEIAKRQADRAERQAENQANCDGFGSGTGNHRAGFNNKH